MLRIRHTWKNSRHIRSLFPDHTIYGGEHIPYLWVHFPGESSWDVFETLLTERHIISTPGVGFGPSGESFIRLSSFSSKIFTRL